VEDQGYKRFLRLNPEKNRFRDLEARTVNFLRGMNYEESVVFAKGLIAQYKKLVRTFGHMFHEDSKDSTGK
jgi:hypothetical protein